MAPDSKQRAEHPARTAMDQLQEVTSSAGQAIDDSLHTAARTLSSGTASANRAYGRAQNRAERFLDTAIAHTQASEETFFEALKDGVKVAQENRAATYAALGTAVVLFSPGLRGVLFRQTLGRLRSQESVLRASERKAKDVADRILYETGESGKLDQRLDSALAQWQAGLTKTRATASQMQSLASTIGRTEKQASGVIHNLRYLPGREALKLRHEVALQLAAAQRQRAKIDKQLWNLTKQGV